MRGKKVIESLEEQISKEINRRKNSTNLWYAISSDTLKTIYKRLQKIKKILQFSKYDILFIGKVGVGKTTAICHLFNLLYEHKEKKKIKKGDKVEYKTIPTIKEILSTGSGKTTICEVIIKPGSETYIEISPYSTEDIIELIKEFCLDIWQQKYPNNESGDSSQPFPSFPSELFRAVRNIVNLQRKGNSIDEAINLAKKFNSSQINDFTREVIKRAKLSQRKKTKFYFREDVNSIKINDIEAEKEWIKNRFSEINLAKMSNCSIPKQIFIYVSQNIIDFKRYPKINSIIDTKGIDEVKIRKDLESYIRDKDQTICIFAENFNSVPSNVSELIGRYLTNESKDIDTKFALLVLPKYGEEAQVLSTNGKVEDRDEGIDVRKSQIKDSFRQQKIKFIPDNIFFYDAKQFYLNDGRIDPDCEISDIDLENKRLISEVYNLIKRRENRLIAEIRKLKEDFERIRNGDFLKPEDEKVFNKLKKNIEEQEIIKNPKDELTSKFIQSLKNHHVMVFRAINNRYGKYDFRNIDIYFNCKNLAEDLVKKNLQ